jgi:tRNA pseudouridine55 synthase
MGHGGTLDPMASGVLIIGIGRGTKDLSKFLGGTKTYEVVVLFGKSTDTFDVTGAVTNEQLSGDLDKITQEVIKAQLPAFRGTFKQMPPTYSALKVNGMKAHEYIRAGLPLPRELEAREVTVDACDILEFLASGQHDYRWQTTDDAPAAAPAVRIRLTVSSGFYVRSLCHELGLACGNFATMAKLMRTRQSGYVLEGQGVVGEEVAISWEDMQAGEEVWGPKIRACLGRWMGANPVKVVQMNGHGRTRKREDEGERGGSNEGDSGDVEAKREVKQRFRGEWLAGTKKERIKQQGGKWKGKYNQPKAKKVEEASVDADHQT